MAITFYNTLARRQEEFTPLKKGAATMYMCGPTVYDYFHIGNARSFIGADVIRRYLQYRGYEVTFVMNITDIDDKIINRASQERVEASEIATKYTDAFLEDIQQLGIRQADIYPRATECIPQIVKHIQALINKGFAYPVGGDVYYSVDAFTEYGKLSGKRLEDLQAGARVDVDIRKRNLMDFALWKTAKTAEPSWDSPWGRGRPGWHIECSVMSQMHLGSTFDIHAGGSDLIFPHHENEIAQSEALTGKPLAHYWLHFGFLNIDNEKMSKSLGNFFTARDIRKRYSAQAVRLFFLQTHYRSPLNFTSDGLDGAEKGQRRFQSTYESLSNSPDGSGVLDVTPYEERFISAVDNDMNFPAGIGILFDLLREVNNLLHGKWGMTAQSRESVKDFLERTAGETLGILGKEEEEQITTREFDELMKLVMHIRSLARDQKQWQIADTIRTGLQELGIVIEDGKTGSVWKHMK